MINRYYNQKYNWWRHWEFLPTALKPHYVKHGLLLVLMSIAYPCSAQNITITATSTQAPDFGRIVNGSIPSIIEIQPDGSTQVISGNLSFAGGSSSSLQFTVKCGNDKGNAKKCDQDDLYLRAEIIGASTNELLEVTELLLGSGATLISRGSPVVANIGIIGQGGQRTYTLGAAASVSIGSTGGGVATVPIIVGVDLGSPVKQGGGNDSVSSNVRADIVRGLTITSTEDLVFGALIKPSSGGGTISISPTGVITSSLFLLNGGQARRQAQFQVVGEGGSQVTLTIPADVTLTNDSGDTLTVLTSNSLSGSQLLSSAPGSLGSLDFGIGGTVTVTSATPPGTYSGQLHVTTSYN